MKNVTLIVFIFIFCFLNFLPGANDVVIRNFVSDNELIIPGKDILTVSFDLESRNGVVVLLVISKENGEMVKSINAGLLKDGIHNIQWDGKDTVGKLVKDGEYNCRVKYFEFVEPESKVFAKFWPDFKDVTSWWKPFANENLKITETGTYNTSSTTQVTTNGVVTSAGTISSNGVTTSANTSITTTNYSVTYGNTLRKYTGQCISNGPEYTSIFAIDCYKREIIQFDLDGNKIKVIKKNLEDGTEIYPVSLKCSDSNAIWLSDLKNFQLIEIDETWRKNNTIGKFGNEDGKFLQPNSFTIDKFGNFYVADGKQRKIHKFNSDGDFLLKFGNYGSGADEFSKISSIDCDSFGNLYILDIGNFKIMKFDSEGKFIKKWGRYSTGTDGFSTLTSLHVTTEDLLFILGKKIYIYDLDGNRLHSWELKDENSSRKYSPEYISVFPDRTLYVGCPWDSKIIRCAAPYTITEDEFAVVAVTVKRPKK